MEVKYKCRCMKEEATVLVPDRHKNSDLMRWMSIVQQCLGYDHSARSPQCRSREMEYAKIPFTDGSEGVGIPPTKQ